MREMASQKWSVKKQLWRSMTDRVKESNSDRRYKETKNT